MIRLEQHLSALGRQKVLRVGDVMLDDFVYGEVSRDSSEAPVRVINVRREEINAGGAGNVEWRAQDISGE